MADFQPLDFNYRLDPSLIAPPSSDFTSAAGLGGILGGSGGMSLSANSLTSLGAGQSSGPGNLFSNLFGSGGGGGGLFSRQSMFGGTDPSTGVSTGGWAPIVLGIGQAIFGGIQGNKALGLARDQFAESKRQFDLNFEAQRKTINTNLEDRQRARVASNSSAYEDVDSYLKKNRV